MQIDPSKRAHAQNRFLRRLNNREGISESPIGPRGTPIPGPLTPVEIAHKARRRERRLAKAKSAASLLPARLASFKQEPDRLQKLDAPQDAKALKEHLHKIEHVKLTISTCEREISRAARILSALS